MNTMGDYHDLYLKTAVLLLADIFKKFINTCLEYYGVDTCHYFTSPGTLNVMLKITGIRVMRRGISSIAIRHIKASNKYTKWYDEYKIKQIYYKGWRK